MFFKLVYVECISGSLGMAASMHMQNNPYVTDHPHPPATSTCPQGVNFLEKLRYEEGWLELASLFERLHGGHEHVRRAALHPRDLHSKPLGFRV